MRLLPSFVASGVLLVSAIVPAWGQLEQGILDTIRFGDPGAEASHELLADHSQCVTGALRWPARQLLPLEPAGDYGGSLAFHVKVDPQKLTYFTVKLWGSDAGSDRGRLLLFCEGKQVGYRHIGDVDCLDIMSAEPRFPGRFTYITTILPKAMTAGHERVTVQIRALGQIWGYGETWEKFQKHLEKPSRGIYAAYSHTDPLFAPPTGEQQGAVPAEPPIRQQPGAEVMDQLKERVNNEILKCLAKSELNQMEMQFLAEAYHVKWTPAYHNPQAVEKLVHALDRIYLTCKQDPRFIEFDRATPNPDWFGLGPSGDAVRLLSAQLQPFLDGKIAGAESVTRREGWSEMLLEAREWHRQHRRQYTNQTMIKDLYGIYLANRGIAAIDPSRAMPEAEAKRYLYESVGLIPWLGSDTEHGPAKPLGDHYMQLTAKGLTKELGYVGAYGEVLDWVTKIYNCTRPTPDAEGDGRIKAQLIRIAQARAGFRYPLLDADGNRAMVLETPIGWRDSHYPGDITYAQRPTWDDSPLSTAAATLDQHLVGYARQMLADNQYFASMQQRMSDRGFRVTHGLLDWPDAYEKIKAQPASPYRLPMTPGQDDFVFSDEDDGVVAVKHGDEILYASLYWRARFAVNFLARVHYLTPTVERDATVWEDVQYDDSGLTYRRDGRTIEAQTTRHEKSRGDLKQALEGELLPIAKVPEGLAFRPGQENVYAGKGTFYTLRYGNYLIGMNCTSDRTYTLKVPLGGGQATDLVTGHVVVLGKAIELGPRSTVVLYLGQ